MDVKSTVLLLATEAPPAGGRRQTTDTERQPRASHRADEGYDEALVCRVTRPCQRESFGCLIPYYYFLEIVELCYKFNTPILLCC